jgi:hypothetical protein
MWFCAVVLDIELGLLEVIFLFPEVDYIQVLIPDITRKVIYLVLGGRLHVIFLFSEVASRDVFVLGEQGFSLPRR